MPGLDPRPTRSPANDLRALWSVLPLEATSRVVPELQEVDFLSHAPMLEVGCDRSSPVEAQSLTEPLLRTLLAHPERLADLFPRGPDVVSIGDGVVDDRSYVPEQLDGGLEPVVPVLRVEPS